MDLIIFRYLRIAKINLCKLLFCWFFLAVSGMQAWSWIFFFDISPHHPHQVGKVALSTNFPPTFGNPGNQPVTSPLFFRFGRMQLLGDFGPTFTHRCDGRRIGGRVFSSSFVWNPRSSLAMIRRDVLGHGLDTVGWKKSGDFKPPEIYKGLLKACK